MDRDPSLAPQREGREGFPAHSALLQIAREKWVDPSAAALRADVQEVCSEIAMAAEAVRMTLNSSAGAAPKHAKPKNKKKGMRTASEVPGGLAQYVFAKGADDNRHAVWAIRAELLTQLRLDDELTFFAPRPLSNTLLSIDIPEGQKDTTFDRVAVSGRIVDADLDAYAREMLHLIEVLLAPDVAAAAQVLCPADSVRCCKQRLSWRGPTGA